MNKPLLIAVMTLTAGPIVHPPCARAETNTTSCVSQGVADAGYQLEIAADRKTAQLFEESFVGAKKIADMDCEILPVKRYPDALVNPLLCRDARQPGTGIVAREFTGGFVFQHYVTLTRGNQPLPFGHLNCQRNTD